ncbi:hypothetical protein H9Q74_006304 [Fusarium xylarioides]|nr:hypothetical protein H9Q74_006304 [Fusarium xylarioides]
MKPFTLATLATALLSNQATALPKLDADTPIPLNAFKFGARDAKNPHLGVDPEPIRKFASQAPTNLGKRAIDFDPKEQLVDVHGKHEFNPPDFEAGDVRGLCPGLNTLANHGYLPHNGVATFTQYVTAVGKVWGMAPDISAFLTTLGVVLGGNLVAVSQGGWSKYMNNNLLGLFGTPRGLSGSHPFFEVDGSPTRGDLYDPIGDNNDMNMTYFMELYNLQKDAENPNYSIDVLGWLVRASPYSFTARLAANRSTEHPDDGILDKEMLKAFFSVYGPEENMTYVIGHERIPENFYRRRYTDYGIAANALDIVTHSHPEGNNLVCFALNAIKTVSPNALSSLFATLSSVTDVLFAALEPIMGAMDCPVYKDLSVNGTNWLDYNKKMYPGFKKAGGGW